MHRVSDGFDLFQVEIGQGNTIDFFGSEFVGISWRPDGSGFATSAYIGIQTNLGADAAAAGIIFYAPNAAGDNYVRTQLLTTPSITNLGTTIVTETHAYPTYSPDGQKLAFSIAEQPEQNGFYSPAGNPETAVLRLISAAGGMPSPIPGAPFGFFPSVVPLPSGLNCGDVNGDGDVNSGDVSTFRSALADPVGSGLTPEGTANCTVIGVAGPCDAVDVAVLTRAVNDPPLPPGIAPVCGPGS